MWIAPAGFGYMYWTAIDVSPFTRRRCRLFGYFDVDVIRFEAQESQMKIPHMGWNTISLNKESFIPNSLNGKYVYYVHSYYVPVNEYTIAQTDYIIPYSAALNKDNFYATQFHPEKSGDIGEQILKSFIEL